MPIFANLTAAVLAIAAAVPAAAQIAADQAQPGPSMPSTQAAAEAPMAEWKPLDGSNFFGELTEKWIPVPNGSGGAPRQGWLNTADGFFTREAHVAYDYTDGRGFDVHTVLARFNYPLSRRFWVGLEVPFYRNIGIDGLGRVDGVADGTLTTQVMLAETRDLSLNAGVGWRLPWGSSRIGGGSFGAQPQINLFRDLGHGFALRGRLGYQFNDRRGGSDAVVVNAAIGQTITPHDRVPFGDFTYYLSANYSEPTDRGSSFVSLTPGVRSHLGGNLFFLTGVEVPVINRSRTFSTRIFAQFVQGF